jgi:hypothetical protein
MGQSAGGIALPCARRFDRSVGSFSKHHARRNRSMAELLRRAQTSNRCLVILLRIPTAVDRPPPRAPAGAQSLPKNLTRL